MALFNTNNQQKVLAQYQQLLAEKNRTPEKLTSDQPIVGLRVWKVITEGGLPKLRSVYKDTVWPYRKALERDCLNDMGIHAVKSGIRVGAPTVYDPAGILGAGMDVISLFASYEADIAGEVYLWGRVDEHTEGYLADFAYPKRLFPHSDLDPVVVMQLEDEYGVPCEYRTEFEKRKAIPENLIPRTSLNATATSALQMQQMMAQQMQNIYPQMQQGMQNALIYGSGLFNPFGKP